MFYCVGYIPPGLFKNNPEYQKVQPLRILIPGKALNEIMRMIDDSDEIIECTCSDKDIIFITDSL